MSSAFACTGVPTPSPPSGGGRHIAVFNAPQSGHVNPTLAVVAELVARGHRVSYAITEDFARQVKAAGANIVTYRLPSTNLESSEDLTAGAAQAMQQNMRALPELMAAFADDTPDLVLYDLAAAGGGCSPRTGRFPRCCSLRPTCLTRVSCQSCTGCRI